MDGKAALCGAVLISRALIMKQEEKLPRAPTTRQREGLAVVVKVQSVPMPLRKRNSLCSIRFHIDVPKAELSLHISRILQVVNKRGSKEN